ncbi:MAG: class I SAM-dependent methyltransferase [Sandaracinaceae bacterium]
MTQTSERFWERVGQRAKPGDFGATFLSEHHRYGEHVHRMELRRLTPHIGSGAAVVDVGCGTGRLAVALHDRGATVTAFDLSRALVETARQASGGRAIQFEVGAADAEWPVEPGRADVVLLSGVLNCIDDEGVDRALSQAFDALSPGGTLYVRNSAACGARFHREASEDLPPMTYRTGEEYVDRVRAAGFLVREDGYLYAPLLPPNLVYYHLLPAAVRDRSPISEALDAWFALERMTDVPRRRWFRSLYPRLLRKLGKRTAFRVVFATRPGDP